MPDQFHFLQPYWFLALLPGLLLLAWLPRTASAAGQWQRACESHLLPHLLNKPVRAISRLPVWLLAVGWLLAVTALADPVWQKLPQPVYRSQDALVVVLDLSQSMLSGDLAPSRLERARFKVADILKRRREGQTGLVVFAGDAFTVSPLTRDARTVSALLTPLSPDLMPVQGSRADLGIQQAGALLKQAGLNQGNILLVTDGYSEPQVLDVAARLRAENYRLSVLGVGSDKPAPIPDHQGGFVRDRQGRVVMPALNVAELQRLASTGGGHYSSITIGDADLKRVLPSTTRAPEGRLQHTEQITDTWRSQGPWLVLALLPLAALAFRRGWLLLLPVMLMLSLSGMPRPAMAGIWADLWARPDQQADQALRAGDAKRARQLARQPLRRGEAAYRAGDYQQAANDFDATDTAQSNYNRGNSLAQLGHYHEAIAAYDKALHDEPDLADASHNRQVLEKLLQQQQQKNKQKQAQKQQNRNGKGGKQKPASAQADNRHPDQPADNGQSKPSPGNSGGQRREPSPPSENNAGNQAPRPQDKAAQAAAGAHKAGDREKNKAGVKAQQDHPSTPQQAGNEKPRQPPSAKAQPATREQAEQDRQPTATAGAAQDTAQSEQQQADERWLRRIPDDPGGLLRRKFLYQYSQRDAAKRQQQQQTW